MTNFFKDFKENETFGAYAVSFEDNLNYLTKSTKENLLKSAKNYPKAKLLQFKFADVMDLARKLKINEEQAKGLVDEMHLRENYVVFIGVGQKFDAVT